METQVPDTAPGPYYVSMIDGTRSALLSGPYALHRDALCAVSEASRIVSEIDPRAWFYSFGTVRMVATYNTPGILQKLGKMESTQ